MVGDAYNPSYPGAEAEESNKREAEVAVSQNDTIALQPGQQEQNSIPQKSGEPPGENLII